MRTRYSDTHFRFNRILAMVANCQI